MHEPTAFERFLIELAGRLTALPAREVDGILDAVLREIGEALGTDRVTLVEFETQAVTHAWARPGSEAAVPAAGLSSAWPWYYDTIANDDVVSLAHVDADLPPAAEQERRVARAAGLKSHLAVPIAVGGRRVCALSTSTFRHYCAWSPHLIARFRLVGQIVAQAIDRARADAARPGDAPSRRPGRPARRRAKMPRLDEVERDYILQVIDRCHGKINGRGHAADVLGLHPNTLRSRMKKLGIRRRAKRGIGR